MMHASITVFTVKDVMESLAYYRDKLGFDVAFEYGKPTFYVGLCSGEVTLAPDRRARTPRPARPWCRLHISSMMSTRCMSSSSKRGAKVLKEPKDYDYGLRDFDVADLDGNMIFFGMESKKV